MNRASVDVYVRFRPLSSQEVADGHGQVQVQVTQDNVATVVANNGQKKTQIRGLAGVFTPEHNNRNVFDTLLRDHLAAVVAGQTVAVFSYGHTGTGKTHTTVGSNTEPGLFSQACTVLCEHLSCTPDLFIMVRFCELYNNKCYDLLNNRAECSLRDDAEGRTHIRAATVKLENGAVRVTPPKAEIVRSAADAAAVFGKAMKMRRVGSSMQHDQSSRSHAILELEFVSPELVKAREEGITAESELIPLLNARDDYLKETALKYQYKQAANGNWEPIPDDERDDAQLALRAIEQERLENKCREMEARVAAARATELEILASKRVGGSLVLVDLAGADYENASSNKLDRETLRESRAINAGLLALKECFRALRTGKGHAPFRDTVLTRVLKRFLTDNNSVRTVMVATSSISEKHVGQSLNTLRYASMVAV